MSTEATSIPEVVERVLELCQASQAEDAARRPPPSPDALPVANIMELRGPTNAELELREFLRRQTAGVVYALAAVMYVGRDGGDFLALYEQMSDTFPTPEIAIDQMLRKTPLADYLQRGIDRLAAAGIDVDALLL